MVKIIFPSIDLSNVKGVLIDLDDTLYSYKNAHQIALEKCFAFYQKNINSAISYDSFKADYRLYRDNVTSNLLPLASCRSRLLAFQIWFENIKLESPYSKALLMEETYWTELIQAMKISDEALDFLKLCQSKNIPVCVVTDMTAQQQMKKIQKLDIEQYISALVTSEEAGIEKPSPKMFQLALKKINLTPGDAIMIGDHLEKDIQVAQELGIKSYRVLSEN